MMVLASVISPDQIISTASSSLRRSIAMSSSSGLSVVSRGTGRRSWATKMSMTSSQYPMALWMLVSGSMRSASKPTSSISSRRAVSIVGSAIDEDSARAFAWLQAAADEVYAAPYETCDGQTAAIIESKYQLAVDGATREAKAVCATCEVAEECLAFARDLRYELTGTVVVREHEPIR